MYCFKPLTGELQWKTYIGSLATSVSVGKKYIAGFMGQQAAWSPDGKYLAVKTNTSLYVCKAKTGEVLWSKKVVDSYGGNIVLYCSEDAKYIAAGFCEKQGMGKLYFYKRTA